MVTKRMLPPTPGLYRPVASFFCFFTYQCDRSGSVSLPLHRSFVTILSGYNLLTIQFTTLKCTIQWFYCIHRVMYPSQFQTFLSPQKEAPCPFVVTPIFSAPSLWQQFICFLSLWIDPFQRFHMNRLMCMQSFVTSFFHSAYFQNLPMLQHVSTSFNNYYC